MTPKKKAAESKAASRAGRPDAAPISKMAEKPPPTEAYEEAVREFGAALGLLRDGSYADALGKFRAIRVANPDEPALAERARTYETICEKKLSPAAPDPQSAEDLYLLGVMRANAGQVEEAVRLLDRAVALQPGSAAPIYARAAAKALHGSPEAAASDLRLAIRLDPSCRHQAANDPDFEQIRNAAVFIDVMEPANE